MNRSEKRDELVDDTVHKMRKLFQKWNDRLAPDNLRLSERYLKGDLEVQVLFRWHRGQEPTYFCAIFCRRHCSVWLETPAPVSFAAELNSYHLDSVEIAAHRHHAHAESGDDQEMMLVVNVELMECPKSIVPSLVRLGSLNEIYRSRTHSLYLGRRFGFVFGRSITDREASLLGRCASICFDQLPSQVVERCPQIVNCITNDESEIVGSISTNLDPKDFVSRVRIVLDERSIRVTVPKDLHSPFEIVDVLFGPFDFRPDAD
jgi:hypothetical protein